MTAMSTAIILGFVVYIIILFGCFGVFLILLPTILDGATRRERVMATFLAGFFLVLLVAMLM